MDVYGVIYVLIDGTNDMKYVGQTTRTAEERFKEHMNHKKQYIDKMIHAHGKDLFTWAIIKECYSQEELDCWEKHMIKSRDTKFPNGYNMTNGGEKSLGWHHTSKSKAIMSNKSKSWKRTLEYRTKQSVAHKGKKLSPEHCAKIGAAHTGRKRPPETGRKISASKTGKKRDSKTVAKVAETQSKASPYKVLRAEITKRELTYKTVAPSIGLSRRSFAHRMSGR